MTRNNDKAAFAFIQQKAAFDRVLERMKRLSDEHFGVVLAEVNWTDVDTLQRHNILMKSITDSAFREGEYAD